MCGIVGGIAERNVVPVLLEGLKRLEYRGYDSAGIVVQDNSHRLQRVRAVGKIVNLEQKLLADVETSAGSSGYVINGHIGIAHTRWATHGAPSEKNAHPHICNDQVAVVHNGIIENHAALREQQLQQGYRFTSDTDTEVIVHALYQELQQGNDLLQALQQTITQLHGAYALAVTAVSEPNRLVVARKGSPLVIGVGIGEYFIASDVSALLPVTQQFIFLEEGDVASLTKDSLQIFDSSGAVVERAVRLSSLSAASLDLGEHRHYMHKEIFEQPKAISDTLEGRIYNGNLSAAAFGHQAELLLQQVKQVQIVACGTSYHAGMVAKYWIEDLLQISCQVEVASEYRYRNPVVQDNTLFVTISQSGETADTLAALQQIKLIRKAKQLKLPTLSICNVPESSLTRESDLVFLTHAGPEIGVASTKAFTTQLTALALLLVALGQQTKRLTKVQQTDIIASLQQLPGAMLRALQQEQVIAELAREFANKHNALFLGRGALYPIAMEGALKLKEISYIHAEAYPAGELKHGPLALIDAETPVISVAPTNDLLEKLKSNLHEVNARGGYMIVFEDDSSDISSESEYMVIKAVEHCSAITAPILFTLPLQLLSYHVALIKGTDVDQPRNLAKSVTVE